MGKRNKRKPEPVAYVRGATWQDVMSGKPVTVAENRKQKNQNGKPAPYTTQVKCRECGEADRVAKLEFLRAASPRCMACGGILDPVIGEQTPKPTTSDKPTHHPGQTTIAPRKRAVLTCRHCGRNREAGVLLCEGCSSPWVKLRSQSPEAGQ